MSDLADLLDDSMGEDYTGILLELQQLSEEITNAEDEEAQD